MKDTVQENKQLVNEYCLDCMWLHIGKNVSHNHCYYPYDRTYDDIKEGLVNGRTSFGYSGRCNQKNVPDRFSTL